MNDFPQDVIVEIKKGQVIMAIKKYQKITNCSLKDAKEAVERYIKDNKDEISNVNINETTVKIDDKDVPSIVVEHLKNNQKIMAIKEYRNATGYSLSKSKKDIEILEKHVLNKLIINTQDSNFEVSNVKQYNHNNSNPELKSNSNVFKSLMVIIIVVIVVMFLIIYK